jgi:hypothetical protein
MSAIEPRALRPKDFCRRYSIGMTKFYELVNAGEIKLRKSDKASLVDVAEAERWFNSLPTVDPKAA